MSNPVSRGVSVRGDESLFREGPKAERADAKRRLDGAAVDVALPPWFFLRTLV
jgi:hypothetical protein